MHVACDTDATGELFAQLFNHFCPFHQAYDSAVSGISYNYISDNVNALESATLIADIKSDIQTWRFG